MPAPDLLQTTALTFPAGRGVFLKKEAPGDIKEMEAAMTQLTKELSDAVALLSTSRDEYRKSAADLVQLKKDTEGRKAIDLEMQSKISKAAEDTANALAMVQACTEAVEFIRKTMDSPLYRGGTDLANSDREAAIALQRNAFLFKGGDQDDFRPDLDNLVNPADYRSAVRKLMNVGKPGESKARIINGLTAAERKAFDAASLDSAFFSPQMLGIEVDCEIECSSLLDLYDTVNVSRSTFMYPHVISYGDIGTYDCDAKCDAEFGPEGNITWKNGNTYDFRGVFCFQRDTLREANYDLLGFMMRAAARSYRINRNRVNIVGNGVNEPMGWLTADCFRKLQTPAANPTHQDLRQFWHAFPMEYGRARAIMHQNTFAYFVSMVDSSGRFIFGDGLMNVWNEDLRDRKSVV